MFHDVILNPEKTQEAFGYYPDALPAGSHQKVVVECLGCHRLIHREYRNVNSKHQCPVVVGDKKRCHNCKEWKDLSLFNKAPKLSGGVSKMCRQCFNSHRSVVACEALRLQRRKRALVDGDVDYYIQYRASATKSHAKNKGVPYDLDAEFLRQLWHSQSGRCYYTGLPMTGSMQQDGFQSWNAPSLDRKEPHLGYIRDNVVWCIFGVNSFKQSLNDTQFKEAIQKIIWWFEGN